MDDLIFIDDRTIANYVMFKLDKIDNGFKREELDKINEVVIDYNDRDEKSFDILKEILKLRKLESITIRNGYIYNMDFNVLLKFDELSDIVFENCEFENADLIASLKLKKLSLIDCKINSYLFVGILSDLVELSLVNCKISFDIINKLKNLKYLQLSYSKVIGDGVLDLTELEEIYLDNTNISDFSFLSCQSNLKSIYIDLKQFSSNEEFFNKFINRGVNVSFDYNMILDGDDNGV